MESSASFGLAALAAGGAALGLLKARQRLALSFAKHPSLAGHPRLARRFAALIRHYDMPAERWFRADDAPAAIADRRGAAFDRLAEDYRARFARTIALKGEAKSGLSDLQFTDAYRVPFPFSRRVEERLGGSPFLASSAGVSLTDVDGNVFLDVAGSYGVNLLGYDAYKRFVADAIHAVDALGPVLGAYHPIVVDNVARLRRISGLDEVSFHMSGTEAVMQAVRLARYHTRRRRVVRFCGAYHGWWGDVQPGIGNPEPARSTLTLADMSERSLEIIRRRRDIACVLVNPLQALHPNLQAPGDSGLIGSGRAAGFDRDAYARWLGRLREVCTERGIVLILDEVFLGFRLARGGAQEYFGVRADMVTYGKTLGGGLPVGVVCGRRAYMRRYREDRPADICFARGTFNAHPYVMAAMQNFLRRLDDPDMGALYADLDPLWRARAADINARLEREALPVRIAALGTVWTVLYTRPSRYNWMFQFYLRAHGLALSWVGTGRLIFSLNYTEADFDAVARRFVDAARQMEGDGWWWTAPDAARRSVPIGRRFVRDMIELGWLRRTRRST